MLKRIDRLERSRRKDEPFYDPLEACLRSWAALDATTDVDCAGRAYSLLPRKPGSHEVESALALQMRRYNRMVERLRQERERPA